MSSYISYLKAAPEEHPSHRSTKCRGNPSRRSTGHKVSLLPVLPEGPQAVSLNVEACRLALKEMS